MRHAIRLVQDGQGSMVSLFDSSVPEPTELLRETVAEAFEGQISSRYASAFVSGNRYVVAALADHYGVSADSVLCTTGATGALALVYRALLAPGDRVLVERPGFDLFGSLAEAAGMGVDHFEREAPDYRLDLDYIAASITKHTRMIVLSNLHNPSGKLIAPADLVALAELAERHDIYCLIDEVYRDYAPIGVAGAYGAGVSDRFISISSMTKIFGLATLRCGWVIADPAVTQKVRTLSDATEFGISNLAHSVAALVLEKPEPFTRYWQSMLTASRPVIEYYHRQWLFDGLVEGDLPEYGCITFPCLPDIPDTLAFADWLCRSRGIAVAPGEYFGSPGHIRIGFGKDPKMLDSGLSQITEAFLAYRKGRVPGLVRQC